MDCPDCDAPTVAVAVPEDLREYTADAIGGADDPSAVAVCTRCLRIHVTDAAGEPAELGVVSDALPGDPEAALALLLAASLMDSLAGNRQAVESLVVHAERAGVDPALAFDRLAADPDLEPAVDLSRRYGQFEQLRG